MENEIKPYYQDESCKIYNGDYLQFIKNISADYCFTSPPYNQGRSIGGSTRGIKKIYSGYDDNLAIGQYAEMLSNLTDKLFPVISKYLIINIMYGTNNKFDLYKWLGKYYSNIKDVLVWEKPIQPAMCNNILTHNYENIFILSKEPENRKYNKDFGNKGDYRTCFKMRPNTRINKLRFACKGNLAIMPIQLAHHIIETFTKPNDTILDPFLGSGTTARACKDLGRKCIGIEISKEYCDIAVRRLGQEVLF